MSSDVMKTTKNRVLKMLQLAYSIQNGFIKEVSETNNDCLFMTSGVKVSTALTENPGLEVVRDYDIDLEIIDTIFTVKEICGVNFTLVSTNSMIGISKEDAVNYIFNLENLKNLLIEKFAISPDKEREVKDIVKSDNVVQELLPVTAPETVDVNKTTSDIQNDAMEQYLLHEIMNSLSNNPMASITLMQKKMEGKLTRENLMKIASVSSGMGGGFRSNPLTTMMMMQALNSL